MLQFQGLQIGISSALFLALTSLCLECTLTASPPSFADRRDYADVAGRITADVNGDGFLDMICGDANGITVVFGNGNGTFRPGAFSDPSFETGGLVAADLNGDGKMDLVLVGGAGKAASGYVGVSYGNGDGTFQTAISYPCGTDDDMTYVVLADFNGDGIPDVATLGERGVWLFTGSGGGVLNPGVLFPVLNAGEEDTLVATDVNNDGNLDLVARTLSGFSVLLGNSKGSFTTGAAIVTPFLG